MAFNWNRFAYTNFHELNLDWFNEHFKEIFEEWEELYNTLTQWKDDTDADLAQWKEDTLAEMNTWERELLAALDEWKTDTGNDISDWEADVISDLNDWKETFLAAYESLEDRVEAIVSDTEEMIENLAEPFSTSQTYSAGDYVIYNGILYMFTSNHAIGAWNSGEVTQKTAMNDMRNYDNTLIDKTWDVGSYNRFNKNTVTSGYTIAKDGTLSASANWSVSDYIPVEPGIILYSSYYSPGSFCLYDIGRNVISNSSTPNMSSPYTIPSGAYYIRVSVKTANLESVYVSTINSIDEYKKLLPYIHDNIERIDANIDSIENDLDNVDDWLALETIPLELIQHETMLQGQYVENSVIGNPSSLNTRCAYTRIIPLSELDNANFVFSTSGIYQVSFLGFNSSGSCVSTPGAWLNDGTYTKAQIISNGNIPSNAGYFSFQIKKTNSGNVTPMDADSIASIIVRQRKTVDVILFIGQSNMAGRGAAAQAPILIPRAGFEYKAITNPNALSPMQEPFGYAENNVNGINDGTSKTGDMVISFTNNYYLNNGKYSVVGISASQGATSIANWAPNGALLNDAISRLAGCVNYLETNGFIIRHKYALFCQGETDGDNGTTAANYKTAFRATASALINAGIERVFMVRIGFYNSPDSNLYNTIIQAQTELAQGDDNTIMASTDFASMRARGAMSDTVHYTQAAYNEVGKFSGINMAFYANSNKEPTMYDPYDRTLYYTHKN